FGSDAAKSASFLGEKIVPMCRHFAYVEIPDGQDARQSSLWVEYDMLTATAPNFAMRRVCGRDEIYPVFHELFKKETA
ncbi:MAG: YeaH/YhbH family protein, partial [Betaproteobacteria bacterium]|nr:YeaH/YhbH family protein [Betaproteobacteria bacterium]